MCLLWRVHRFWVAKEHWFYSMTLKAKTEARNKSNERFLDHKRKKTWIDKKSGYHCFMLYPRSLYITWGGSDQYWTWNCFKETSDDNIEVAKLLQVCWLDVRGKFKVSDLLPGIVYEVAYVVKLTKGASGWELPVTLRMSSPDGKVQDRQLSLLEKPRGEWIELIVGNFLTRSGETRELCFDIYQHGGHWKKGLVIKGAILRPKENSTP